MTFNQCNTIAAISTAQGIGGIGVIRVSGDNAISIVDKIFKSVSGKKFVMQKGILRIMDILLMSLEKLWMK